MVTLNKAKDHGHAPLSPSLYKGSFGEVPRRSKRSQASEALEREKGAHFIFYNFKQAAMLPPSSPPPASFGEYWTDEHVILSLDKFNRGSPLPEGVYSEINPYQWEPSNLPEGWYFVHSTERKDTEHGFWRTRGEACEIFKDSAISGWRTTLEFFKGLAPLGQQTGWVMQEYKITQNGPFKENELKVFIPASYAISWILPAFYVSLAIMQGSRTLCRFFLCDGEGPSTEVQTKKKDADTVAGNCSHIVSTAPSAESTSRRDTRGETLVKNTETPAAERLPDSDLAALLELGYFQAGDYLELDDLADQDSRASSSDNSSCKGWISDEDFESLLRDIEDDIEKDQQKEGSSSKFSVAASARPDLLVLQPAAVGSVATAVGSKLPAEKTAPRSAIKADAGRQKAEQRNDGASSSHHEASSSNSQKAILKGEKVSGSKKKLKNKYLCCIPF